MEAPEEVRARATLNEMQLRITQGPYVTLGVPEGAPLDQVRSAFLALTTMTGCQGVNGGGWAHYVGQEKCRPVTGRHFSWPT